MKPINAGIALSVTVMVFYTLCTVAEVIWPAQFIEFMNALFHGLDFKRLATPGPYSWTSFAAALIVMGVWAFAAGTFWVGAQLLVREPRSSRSEGRLSVC